MILRWGKLSSLVDSASLRSKSKLSQPNSTHSLFISTRRLRRTRFSKDWWQAVGIRQLLPCGFWSKASLSRLAVSLVPDSMSFVGKNLGGQGTSCALRAKYWRCDRRDRNQTKD